MFNIKSNTTVETFSQMFSKIDHIYFTRFSVNDFQVCKFNFNSKLTCFGIDFRVQATRNKFLTKVKSIDLFKIKAKEKVLNFSNELAF